MSRFSEIWCNLLHHFWWRVDWYEVGDPPIFFVGRGMRCDKCGRKWEP